MCIRDRCNSAASSLKRGVTRIAAILPALTQDNLLYYEPIWRGVRAYCRDAKDFNIELVELPYVCLLYTSVVEVTDLAPWQEACSKVIEENTADQAELYQQIKDLK